MVVSISFGRGWELLRIETFETEDLVRNAF